jgi:putative flippase GtrA
VRSAAATIAIAIAIAIATATSIAIATVPDPYWTWNRKNQNPLKNHRMIVKKASASSNWDKTIEPNSKKFSMCLMYNP